MTLQPTPETAMAQDDARRARQEAEKQQREKQQSELRDSYDTSSPAAQKEHAADLRKNLSDQKQQARNAPNGPLRRVVINSPHQAQFNGSDIALTIAPQTPEQPKLPNLNLLQVYDTDGITILRDGQVITTPIDTEEFVEFAIYKIDWCQEGVAGTRYAILSTFVPN